MVELTSGKLRWQNKLLGAQASPLLLHEGCIYGFDGYINGPIAGQTLICMDPLTGKEHWRTKSMGGQMILADGQLVMLLVTGELVVAKVSPAKYDELCRVRVQDPEQCPVPPTLANGRLYCRTGGGVLRCLDVAP
jgi:outer membrane protein assembly factor BamB